MRFMDVKPEKIITTVLQYVHRYDLSPFPDPPKATLTISVSGSATPQIGNDVTLVCDVTGNPEPTITWTRDGVVQDGIVGKTWTFPASDDDDGKEFFCTATNDLGEATSNKETLMLESKLRGLRNADA